MANDYSTTTKRPKRIPMRLALAFICPLIIFATLLAVSHSAYAADSSEYVVETTFWGNLKDDGKGCSVFSVVNLIVDILSLGIGILGVVGIMVAGIQFLSAKGNEQQTQKSKRRILEIVIGLAVYAALFLIAQWLLPGGLLNNNTECGTMSNTELANLKAQEAAEREKNAAAANGKTGSNSNNNNQGSSSDPSSPSNSDPSNNTPESNIEKGKNIKMAKNGSNVTIIGDSITVTSKNSIKSYMSKIQFHAKANKHMFTDKKDSEGGKSGATIIKNLIKNNQLREIVVIALGTNDGTNITSAKMQGIIDGINKSGPHRIVLVTNSTRNGPGKQFKTHNKIFMEMAVKYANVSIADWALATISSKSLGFRDNLHPTGSGTKKFAKTIYDAVNK